MFALAQLAELGVGTVATDAARVRSVGHDGPATTRSTGIAVPALVPVLHLSSVNLGRVLQVDATGDDARRRYVAQAVETGRGVATVLQVVDAGGRLGLQVVAAVRRTRMGRYLLTPDRTVVFTDRLPPFDRIYTRTSRE